MTGLMGAATSMGAVEPNTLSVYRASNMQLKEDANSRFNFWKAK